jgi:hypothetical protein
MLLRRFFGPSIVASSGPEIAYSSRHLTLRHSYISLRGCELVAKTDTHRIWPIPPAAQCGLLRPAFAGSEFCSDFFSIVVSQELFMDLGTADALLASTIGSSLFFIYSAAIGCAAHPWGLNFQLMLPAVFGRVRASRPSLVFAELVADWFGFDVGDSRLDTDSFTSRTDSEGLGSAVRTQGLLRVVCGRLRGFCIAFFDTFLGYQTARDPRRSDLHSARWS